MKDCSLSPLLTSHSRQSPRRIRPTKEVSARIENDAKLVNDCIGSLFKKAAFEAKSKDGSLRCTVPSTAQELLLTVALGDVFKSSVMLPRPI
jgi:hypothetical protein